MTRLDIDQANKIAIPLIQIMMINAINHKAYFSEEKYLMHASRFEANGKNTKLVHMAAMVK
jgi:hypothetical protein